MSQAYLGREVHLVPRAYFAIFFINKVLRMRTNIFLKDDFLDYSNPSKNKIPKTCIRVSASKTHLRSPFREIHPNPVRDKSVELLQKCKEELSKKNLKLIKSIEEKQEKVEQLRDTFRRIQRSKSKEASREHKLLTVKKGRKGEETPQVKPSSSILSSTLISKTKLFS